MPTADPPAQVEITNQTASPVTVYLLLYNQPSGDWSFCSTVDNYCQFTLAGNATQSLPSGGYLNFAASFGAEGYGCAAPGGATIAEVNVNNPSWKDQLDVSLVNGYNAKVALVATPFGSTANQVQLGPPNGMSGNENVFGVYPYGCDVCVARCCPGCPNPPLSMTQSNPLSCTVLDPVCTNADTHCTNCTGNGTDGCKTGSQSNPSTPCQYQGINNGGDGGTVQVIYMGS